MAAGAPYSVEEDRLPALLDGETELRVFDAKPLYHIALDAGGEGKAITFDGKLAAYLLNPSASEYSVGHLAAEYGVQRLCVRGLPRRGGCWAGLCEALQAKVTADGMDKLLRTIELPLARVLADMERYGMQLDGAGLEAFGQTLKTELDGCLARIWEAVGYEFNLNSPKQLGQALFDKLGLPPRKKTKSGYSTDAETLESLRGLSPGDRGYPAVPGIPETEQHLCGGAAAAAGSGRPGAQHLYPDRDPHRPHQLHRAESAEHPGAHQLGSRLREFFTAKPGWLLADADYSQIELRILAHISGDETMRQAFANGEGHPPQHRRQDL